MASKRKEHSNDLRQRVVDHIQAGDSYGETARQLKLARSTVQKIFLKYKKVHSVSNIPGRGRKRATTEREDRTILKKMKQNRRKSASSIAAEMGEEFSLKISPTLVRNRLQAAGYHGRIARAKPWIDKCNYIHRVRWARSYLERPLEFWNRVLWSDESKFTLFGSDGMVRVWRTPQETLKKECLKPTVKHGGGSVMVWGCMSASGVGNLTFIEGTMDGEVYQRILDDNLMQSMQKLGMGEGVIFQDDNDPKHRAHAVRDFLLENAIETLPWPAQSPDLNPIEHIWDEMERRMKGRNPSNAQALRELIIETWNSIGPDVTKKLVETISKRCRAVILNKGGPSGY